MPVVLISCSSSTFLASVPMRTQTPSLMRNLHSLRYRYVGAVIRVPSVTSLAATAPLFVHLVKQL